MTISQLETILDLTPPDITIVEWAFRVRSMYFVSGIESYKVLCTILSEITENNPGCGYELVGSSLVVSMVIYHLFESVSLSDK